MRRLLICLSLCLWITAGVSAAEPQRTIDFNREVRPILSNGCYKCHGPDEKERKGGTDGLRLDTLAGATVDLSGQQAIKPGQPEESLLIKRVTSADPDEVMPPRGHGKPLSAAEVATLTEWIRQGAPYAAHWSYVKPTRPALPEVKTTWGHTPVDRFLLARLEKEGLKPQAAADDRTMIRRVALDLTGLPPTTAEVDAFLKDTSANRYEQMVDRFLKKETYGEHWARLWLDLARYADSAGYADDPARVIWAYRDYVIRSFQQNKPFNQFTIEQIAGDLLPEPTDEQLIATAFQRNTLTNSEGGTNDEEFRNVAIVDRVNTTMAVWMGTTIACAQCHTHKYDPLTQEEFFQLFAFYNQSQDADRRDESPLLELWSEAQRTQKKAWQDELAQLDTTLKTTTPALIEAQQRWEASLPKSLTWTPLTPSTVARQSEKPSTIADDGTVKVTDIAGTDRYTVSIPIKATQSLTALRLETPPNAGLAGGNFVLNRVQATIDPPAGQPLKGRFVRIEIPGPQKILSLAEVQVFQGTENIARFGKAMQSSTDYAGPPELAIDGNTDGRYVEAKSTTHTAQSDNPWWEVELKAATPIDRLTIWNRTDANVGARLAQFRVAILDDNRQVVWEQTVAEPPNPSQELSLSGARPIVFTAAFADFSQAGFNPADVLLEAAPKGKKLTGWAIGGQIPQPHQLTLLPSTAVEIPAGSVLKVVLGQESEHANHLLGQFRLVMTNEPQAAALARIPANILNILPKAFAERSAAEQQTLADYYRGIAPALQAARDRQAAVQKSLADMKPYTTVPVMRDLAEAQRRKTQLQHRGNFMDLGQDVSEGVPAVFHSLPSDLPPNRMALARWLIDRENPLTARVMVNRLWEQLFGIGIVASSEDFGSQGELPSHPDLLDWLAVEFMDSGWNTQHMLKLLVMSAAYRQSSVVTDEAFQRDPENRLLARGPRFRMSAEMIRDQALAVSGLLSTKQFGPPVNPPQPKLGLSAAFGSGVDWQTSMGEDKYRRALYTSWRRSNPYPSMSTFDAPNREVCTLRRSRTNTPLQALVTLNDPVYIEAAQALARKTLKDGGATVEEQAKWTWEKCLSRPPTDAELQAVTTLFQRTKERLATQPENAKKLATNPLGPAPEGMDITTLAAWSVAANAILNLDEMFMRR